MKLFLRPLRFRYLKKTDIAKISTNLSTRKKSKKKTHSNKMHSRYCWKGHWIEKHKITAKHSKHEMSCRHWKVWWIHKGDKLSAQNSRLGQAQATAVKVTHLTASGESERGDPLFIELLATSQERLTYFPLVRQNPTWVRRRSRCWGR